MSSRYVQPGWFTRNVFNRGVAGLTRLGISVYGSRILAVRGRTSGEWRTTPVNLLVLGEERYLVAPRGVTQWVRNIRVSRVRGAPPWPEARADPRCRAHRRGEAGNPTAVFAALEG